MTAWPTSRLGALGLVLALAAVFPAGCGGPEIGEPSGAPGASGDEEHPEAVLDPAPFDESKIHTSPTLTEPSGTASGLLEVHATTPHEDCPAGDRTGLEPDSLRLRGTIVGHQDRIAMMASPHGRAEVVRVGQFIGSHCWRVTGIQVESVTMERIPSATEENRHVQTARLFINDKPRPDLSVH